MAEPSKIPAANIRVHQDHVGGGFGSKFGPDRWGIVTAQLSKKAGGKPVRLMLERDSELEVAGARPSAYRARESCEPRMTARSPPGTRTPGARAARAVAACLRFLIVFAVPNQHKEHTAIRNNIGPARAWRAPNHPQAAVLTMSALDDLAAKLNMDPLRVLPEEHRADPARQGLSRRVSHRRRTYWAGRRNGTRVARTSPANIARGLGLSLHTWGGRGHGSDCDLTIHPDGSVDIKMGTQDIGTGTRTCIAVVAADALGLQAEHIKLLYRRHAVSPVGRLGAVHDAGWREFFHARAVVDARDALFAKVAPALNAQPDELEADGRHTCA